MPPKVAAKKEKEKEKAPRKSAKAAAVAAPVPAPAPAVAEAPAIETPVVPAPPVKTPPAKINQAKTLPVEPTVAEKAKPVSTPSPVKAPPAERELPLERDERTVDSINAAAKEDARRDASNFSTPKTSSELRPPSAPVEPSEEDIRLGERRGYQRDKIATSLNIAKLQGMSMTDLNSMAKDYGVENFGTMRKHEVIFHILEKNAQRAGVLFSEGVIEVLPEGFGFLRSQSFNYLPCPEDIYVSDRKSVV